MNEKRKLTPALLFERFCYGCGDFGCNIIYTAMSAFLLFYYTDYAGVNAAAVGTIMLISRVFDGVSDIIMGMIVDRTPVKIWKSQGLDTENVYSFCIIRNPAVFCTGISRNDCKTGICIYYI